MGNEEMKLVLGGTSSSTCTCLCYDDNGQELGNLGEVKNVSYCWDACLTKFEDKFKGPICK